MGVRAPGPWMSMSPWLLPPSVPRGARTGRRRWTRRRWRPTVRTGRASPGGGCGQVAGVTGRRLHLVRHATVRPVFPSPPLPWSVDTRPVAHHTHGEIGVGPFDGCSRRHKRLSGNRGPWDPATVTVGEARWFDPEGPMGLLRTQSRCMGAHAGALLSVPPAVPPRGNSLVRLAGQHVSLSRSRPKRCTFQSLR